MEGAFSFAVIFLAFFLHASDGAELVLTPSVEQEKSAGGNFVINCAVNDEAKDVNVAPKWYNPNGEEIKLNNRTKLRESSNSMKLYLFDLKAEDAGTYTCNATVNGKLLEKIINLKIFKKLSLLNCAEFQQPVIGTNAKINCTASGDPAPTVSWQYKGKTLQTGGRYDIKPDGLVIRNITEADNGLYEIESEITIRSDFIVKEIQVNVTIPPVITEPPVMLDPIKGSDFTMTCKADGKPKPTYSWVKDDMTIDDSRFDVDEYGGSLKISSVKETDSGTYTCIASNVGGTAKAKAKVTVLIPPTLRPMSNQQAEENKRVTLLCTGEGVPLPSLTWQKGSDAPFAQGSQASDSRIVVSETKGKQTKLKLTITSLKAEDAANYTCTATNRAGTESKKVQLRIDYSPQFVNTPLVAYNWMNNKRNISCSAKGLPKPLISWQTKYGKIGSIDETYRIFQSEGYELSTSYLQVHVSRSNENTVFTNYQCTATNKLGQKDITITLKQAVVPRAPQKVSHTDLSPTTITLIISKPTNNGGIEVDQYRIEYATGGHYNHTDVFVNSDADDDFTKVVLKRLTPVTKYQIKVFAGNAVGLSTKSYDLSVVTLNVRIPYDVFINSDRLSTSPTSYVVTWQEPRTGGSEITSYSVQYRMVHIKKNVEPWEVDPNAKNGKFIAHTVKGKTRSVINNLESNTYYEVQVVANNIIGPSEPRPMIILTKEKPPGSYDEEDEEEEEEPEYPEEEVVLDEDVDKIDTLKSSSAPRINQTGLLMALNAILCCVWLHLSE